MLTKARPAAKKSLAPLKKEARGSLPIQFAVKQSVVEYTVPSGDTKIASALTRPEASNAIARSLPITIKAVESASE